MYGARGRIGHVCPSIPLDMIINEFQQMLPEGVLMVYSSLYIEQIQQEDFDRALGKLDEAVGHMVEGEADCIIVGVGPVVAMVGSDDDVVKRSESISHVPCNSTTGAMLAAMEHLGAQRLVVATPYTDERNQLLQAYLEQRGFSVVGSRGLGYTRAVDIARLPFDAPHRLACEAVQNAGDADAIYMPCARMPIAGCIDAIERDTGLPVITSTQAMTWWGLKSIGVDEAIEGFGRLLRQAGSIDT
jgi:maleate isomerase